MSLTPKEAKRKRELMLKAQRQDWLLLPSDSAELQAICAKAGQRVETQRIELGEYGSEGISYASIHKYGAKGEWLKELACNVRFGKDKSSKKETQGEELSNSD